ncbi:VOC family protein [Actinocorallia sp. API 0066]|uniref:VOC family protein n=1 Tax=Actinocorallia sp. API 0066 TaxID=2896846 RepID=UPI001E537569|nr:VOC family protein [Actinocorallia sp. API 0066]MCD0448123.1 VOC family protein [Actinocorallia sp. API 0066]
MSLRDGFVPGTPCWVDVSVPDTDAAARFYDGLLGWRAGFDAGPESGGYGQFHLNGKRVAGIGPLMDPSHPPAWTTYIATDDIDATTARVREAGGQVLVEPMQVLQAGRLAGYLDREGAYFMAWQPLEHKGAELVNEPGAWSWNELNTRDPAAAQEFYPKVFGWDAGGDAFYTEWKIDDRTIGGMMPIPPELPPDVPPHWLVYFAVDDVDASAKLAVELGGEQTSPFVDSPAGRLTVLRDPQGAVFALISGLQERH